MTPRKLYYQSPAGKVGLEFLEGGSLAKIEVSGSRSNATRPIRASHPVAKVLERYFETGKGLDKLPVTLQASAFQSKVLRATAQIPAGEVRTYGWVARKIGKPAAARAVGRALATNPLPLAFPCHRVVASNGLGGYGGGLKMKKRLLDIEAHSAG